MPGIAVMALTVAIFQFPVLLIAPTLVVGPARERLAAILASLIVLPLLLVNGAFPVASSGAAPRYVLPLVPFACLFSAIALRGVLDRPRRWSTIVVAASPRWLAGDDVLSASWALSVVV